MRSTATTVIGSAALVLFGCAVGLLLGRWMSSPPPPPDRDEPRAVVPPPDLTPVLVEIQQTRAAILRSLGDRDATTPATSKPREPAETLPEELKRLTTAIDTLAGLVGGSGTPQRGLTSTLVAAKGPGFPSIDALWVKVQEIRKGDNPAFVGALGADLSQAHFAWTRDDVFDRYGTPSLIQLGWQPVEGGPLESTGSMISLVFKRGDQVVGFTVAEGLVIGVYSR